VSRRPPVTREQAERGRAVAEQRVAHPEWYGYEVEWDNDLGVLAPVTHYLKVGICGATIRTTGLPCTWAAGTGTAHPGVGACVRHDTQVERAAGAWMVAHAIARIEDVSPMEGLLLAVKRAAAWAAFYDGKLAGVRDDDDLRPGGDAHDWVVAAERVNDKLARYSKMAVDAGVAAMLVARARTEGEQIVTVLNAALGAVNLTEEQEAAMRAALREALLQVEERTRAETKAVEGTEEPTAE